MKYWLRQLAAGASFILALFAASALTLHEPHEYYPIVFLGFAIASAALFGWSQDWWQGFFGFSREEIFLGLHRLTCLFGHKWDGCKCRRCGTVMNENHAWNGCKCTRCNTMRDENHVWNGCRCVRCNMWRDESHIWEIHACRQHCQRCRKIGEPAHDWNGCCCKQCKKTRHEWQHGLCTRCGMPCPHPEDIYKWNVIETSATVYAVKIGICYFCQMQVSEMCQTPPRIILASDSTHEICNPFPSPEDLAKDLLWLDLRNYWKLLLELKPDFLNQNKLYGLRHSKTLPKLVFNHDEVLNALIKIKQLDSTVAEGVHRAFNELYYLITYTVAIKYGHADPEDDARHDLRFELTDLSKMVERHEIQMESVEHIQACIAQAIALLDRPLATGFPHWQDQPLSSDCNAKEAARVIVALLLNSRNPS